MSKLLANTTLFYGAQLIARLIGFGYMLVLARSLEPDAFGELNLALSILMIADTAADFGLSRLLLNETSRDLGQSHRYLSAFVPLKLLMSALAYACVTAFALLSGYSGGVVTLILVAGLSLAFTGSAMTLEMGLHVRQRFGYVALAHLGLSVIQAGAGLAVLSVGGEATAIAGTYVVTNAVYALIILFGLGRVGALPGLSLEPGFWRDSLKAAAPFGGMALLALLATRVEFLTLGWFGDGVDLGAFAIALKLNDAAMLGPVTLSTVLAPVFARHHAASRADLSRLYLTALRYELLAAVPGALLATAIVPPIMTAVLGDRYGDLAPVITLAFAAFPFAAVHCLNVGLLLSSDRRGGTLALAASLVAAQAAIALGVISTMGREGAAMALLATAVVSSVASTICVRRWFLPDAALFRAIAPALAAAAAMLAASVTLGAPDAVAVAASIALFGALAAPLAFWLTLEPHPAA